MKNQWTEKILIMIGISVGSFIGFNIAFILAAFITLSIAQITGQIGYTVGRFVFLIIIYLVFFGVKRLHIPDWIKASVFSMPIISTLILIGVYGYGLSSYIVIGLGLLFTLSVTYFLYRNKWDWTYYYALSFVSICAAYVIIAGIDI